MSCKAALISSAEHCDYIRGIMKNIELNYELDYVVCPSFRDLPNVFAEIQNQYDAFCTTGAFAREAILRTHGAAEKPFVSISESPAEFYQILFHLLYEDRTCELSRIVFDHSLWIPGLEVITALDYAKGNVRFDDKKRMEFLDRFPLEELLDADRTIVENAKARWADGAFDLIICRHSYAYAFLKENGIPCQFAYPTPDNVIDTLVHLQDELSLMQMNDNLPGVVYLTSPSMQAASAEDIVPESIELQKCLLDFDQEYTTGLMMKKALGGFELYTTRRTLQRITDNFTQCRLCTYMLGRLGLELSVGYGIGRDVMSARTHALEAYNLSVKSGKSYVIGCSGSAPRVLEGAGSPTADEVSEKLKKASQDTGLSVMTLQRIRSAVDLQGNSDITTQDLAGTLQVTVANANRFVNHLLSAGYAEVVGEKKAPLRGRPTRVYRIEL